MNVFKVTIAVNNGHIMIEPRTNGFWLLIVGQESPISMCVIRLRFCIRMQSSSIVVQ